jgi:hypothetical protein
MSVSIGLVNGYVLTYTDADFKENVQEIAKIETMGKKWLKVNDHVVVRIENIAWISDDDLETLDKIENIAWIIDDDLETLDNTLDGVEEWR